MGSRPPGRRKATSTISSTTDSATGFVPGNARESRLQHVLPVIGGVEVGGLDVHVQESFAGGVLAHRLHEIREALQIVVLQKDFAEIAQRSTSRQIQSPGALDASQLVIAALGKRDSGPGDEVLDGLRDQYFAGVREP